MKTTTPFFVKPFPSLQVTGTNSLWAERYGYDADGRRVITLEGNSGTTGDSYWLDGTGQLRNLLYGSTNALSRSTNQTGLVNFLYDGVGNRTLVSGSSTNTNGTVTSWTNNYTANNLNQYTTVGTNSLSYTGRGDLATQGSWSYSYDAQGNLLSASNSATNSAVRAQYFRDASGHRAVKAVNGSQTFFFNLGSLQLEKYDVSSSTPSSTIYEPGTDRPLAEVGANGAVSFYHQDVLGNVVLLTSATGGVVESYSYDAWGRVKVKNGSGTVVTSTPKSRFLFTGREYDSETGLYDYRARAYSPKLGRFLQMDPIDFAGGDVNIFRYCGNSPLDWNDPSGLDGGRVSPTDGPASMGVPSTGDALSQDLSGTRPPKWSDYNEPMNQALDVEQQILEVASTLAEEPLSTIIDIALFAIDFFRDPPNQNPSE